MEKIEIAKIVNTRGINGEIIILSYSDPASNILKYKKFFIKETTFEEIEITKKAHYKGNRFLIKIKGIDNINDALGLKNKSVYIDTSEITKLEDGEFYYFQAVDSDVFIGEKYIGKVRCVHNFGSCDILDILYKDENNKKRQVLLPVLEDYLLSFDLNNKKIVYKDIYINDLL